VVKNKKAAKIRYRVSVIKEYCYGNCSLGTNDYSTGKIYERNVFRYGTICSKRQQVLKELKHGFLSGDNF
jgi:hypothetical protein